MARRKDNERPVCTFGHADCFAHMRNGRCFCLDNTDFGGRKCPFYKNEPVRMDEANATWFLEKCKEENVYDGCGNR